MKNHPILVVDDDPYVAQILCRWLSSDGYSCNSASSGEEALQLLCENDFSLLITDIRMPGISGLELLEQVTERHAELAAIMVTGVDDRQTALKAMELGAYGYIIKPFEKNEILINVAAALRRRELELKQKGYENRLRSEVIEQTRQIHKTQEEITHRLISASSFRDEETGAHIKRIGLYAARLGKALGWSEEKVKDVQLAAPMHDVGKIGIPDEILQKAGPLTSTEFEVAKTHTSIGAKILEESQIPLIRLAAEIALTHHEKWDGTGYPQGLSGEDIPLAGRLVAVCDVYDALVNDRVYRKALLEEEALQIMRDGRGTHFDPTLFDYFLKELPAFREIRNRVSEARSCRSPQAQ